MPLAPTAEDLAYLGDEVVQVDRVDERLRQELLMVTRREQLFRYAARVWASHPATVPGAGEDRDTFKTW